MKLTTNTKSIIFLMTTYDLILSIEKKFGGNVQRFQVTEQKYRVGK